MTAAETPAVTSTGATQARRIAVPSDGVVADATAESFRLLALNVSQLLDPTRRSVLVMSARPRDGRTLATVGVAQALAELGERVLLIDADPVGAAADRASELPPLRYASPGRLGITTQNAFIAKIGELLAAAEAEGLTVVIDTPPCTSSSVAFHLARSVGGVLYVARRRHEDPAIHADVRSQLDLLGARVLGIVFNEG